MSENIVDPPQVTLIRAGAIATIVLNVPQRKNALDGLGFVQLRDALREVQDDDTSRVVVITGAGTDFCSGAAVGGQRNKSHPYRSTLQIHEAAQALHTLSKPSIAKIRGVAVGAGLNIALGCDLVAADTTARLSEIFVKRGLSIDFGGSWVLPRLIGPQQAKRLALLGDFLDAEEALALGLITWAVAPDGLDDLVDGVADRLSKGPPIAMAQTLALIDSSFESSHQQALDSETRCQTVNFATTDGPAARRAFERRTEPVFTGEWGIT